MSARLKTGETCRFGIRPLNKLDGSSNRDWLVGCRSGPRVGLSGLKGSWSQFEEGRNAGVDSGRILPHGHGKTAIFKPATFYGFRNDADSRPGLPHPAWNSMCQKRSGAAPRKRRTKRFDRLVGSSEPDLGREVLMNVLGAQAGLELGLDECLMTRATAREPRIGNRRRGGPWTGRQTGGQRGRSQSGSSLVPGGRNGG